MERNARSPGDVAVIVIFALLLLAPAALALTGNAGVDIAFLQNTEHRNPFAAPPVTRGALATGGWERDAEREIADAFPLRKQLIQSYGFVKYSWLGDVANTKVIRGRDGWFYYGDTERIYLTDPSRPSDAVLAHVADEYAARAAWCARHGIRYVFVLAPNKSTIYPQFLPPDIVPVKPSAADRLLPLMRARGVRAVDVRAALIAAAKHGPVYSKGDTHWNQPGAYIAYRAVVAALRDAGVRETIAPRTIHQHTGTGPGDLLGLSAVDQFVRNEWVYDNYPHRAREIPPPAMPDESAAAAFEVHAFATDDPALPVGVIFGDSFSNALTPFLAESFRRTVQLGYRANVQFDQRVVTAEHPSAVIQELAERNLVNGADFLP
jgi:alginate O-acetyltransferase complex protein AlgJ